MSTLNPRYVAYCKSQGRTPDDQLKHDEEKYPGGSMTGFILWTNEKWNEFGEKMIRDRKIPSKLEGHSLSEHLGLCLGADKHRLFDSWLGIKV